MRLCSFRWCIVNWEPEWRYQYSKLFLLRTIRELSLYKVCGDSALLVLNGTSVNSDSALVALSWRYCLLPLFKIGRKNKKNNMVQNWRCSYLNWCIDFTLVIQGHDCFIEIPIIGNLSFNGKHRRIRDEFRWGGGGGLMSLSRIFFFHCLHENQVVQVPFSWGPGPA